MAMTDFAREFHKKMLPDVSQCLPYIGYPQSLNALGCINKAYENMKG